MVEKEEQNCEEMFEDYQNFKDDAWRRSAFFK
jgi:hypothetical protein